MVKFLFILFFFLFAKISNGQIQPSLSNLLRYGNGNQEIGTLSNKFQYFENLTDFRLSLPNNFNIGLRFLYDDPPEIGENFKGIKRRFIEYNGDKLNFRIGNSSELYGRGLVLNLFENRGLAYDTWLDGIKANYKFDNFKVSLIAGEIEFRDSITVTRFENYKLRGGNLEYNFLDELKLGASFISSEATIPQIDNSNLKSISELPEFYFEFNNEKFNLFFSWANKWTNTSAINKTFEGNGIYSSVSFADESIGITIDYKNYNFDKQNPFLQNDVTRTSKFLPFQNPPIVMKEHSYYFLSRSLHDVDFNDEVGFQLDLNYAANEDLNFNVNFSLASRHNSYILNNSNFEFVEDKRDANFLPINDKKYSPYYEIFAEGEYYFNLNTVMRFGISSRKKTIYNYFSGLNGSHTIKSFVVPLQFQKTFSENFSAIFQYEFEIVNDNYNTGEETFNNQFISILTSLFRKASAALRYEFTNNNFDISGRTNWLVGEFGYRISGSNLLTISYGRERGGQVCTNGICRYFLPFKGLRFTLQTNI
ncbi:MAG: DUF6029 family protein [Melioribacteraceae bacterium]